MYVTVGYLCCVVLNCWRALSVFCVFSLTLLGLMQRNQASYRDCLAEEITCFCFFKTQFLLWLERLTLWQAGFAVSMELGLWLCLVLRGYQVLTGTELHTVVLMMLPSFPAMSKRCWTRREQLLQQGVESETLFSCTDLCAIRDGKLFFCVATFYSPLVLCQNPPRAWWKQRLLLCPRSPCPSSSLKWWERYSRNSPQTALIAVSVTQCSLGLLLIRWLASKL